jgi:hypothetical protein
MVSESLLVQIVVPMEHKTYSTTRGRQPATPISMEIVTDSQPTVNWQIVHLLAGPLNVEE